MASFEKVGTKWRAYVCVAGKRKSASFPSKLLAQQWAAQLELDLHSGVSNFGTNKTFGDMLERYRDEISAFKPGARREKVFINSILKSQVVVNGEQVTLSDIKLPDFGPRHVSAWRDLRLKTVTSATVLREWTVIRSAFNTAITEWQWINSNPMTGVKRPVPGKSRNRIATDEEREAITVVSGYTPGHLPTTLTSRVGAAFQFCCETGLRAGELLGLHHQDINLNKRYITVREGKTLAAARDVPLSSKAEAILKDMIALNNPDQVLGLNSSQLETLFRKIKSHAMIEGLTYHDSRHTAITHLASKLNVLELARMVGHKDLRMLQIYYNKKAEDLALLLD